MQLTTWRPFNDIDDVFRRYLGSVDSRLPALGSNGKTGVAWEPSADVTETKKEYLVKAILPGVSKEDVHVDLKDNLLTISGTREDTSEVDEETVHRRESFYGSFSRTFSLPDNVDSSKLKAECKKGVLCVHLPKTKEAKKQSSINIPIE